MMIRDHTAKAVVDTKDMAVTNTHMAGKETTITVVVVPAVAEAIMAVVEVAYPNRLTRPNQLVTDAGWKTIGQRIVEPLNIYVSSIKRALRTRTQKPIWFMIPGMMLMMIPTLKGTTSWILRLLIVSKTKIDILSYCFMNCFDFIAIISCLSLFDNVNDFIDTKNCLKGIIVRV